MATLTPPNEKNDTEYAVGGLEAGDDTSSIPSFTALIEEGEISRNPSNVLSKKRLAYTVSQITVMISSSGPCRGRRQPGCSPETKSVLPLWLRHGRSREFALIGNTNFAILIDVSSAS
jgi:hypothetical protein